MCKIKGVTLSARVSERTGKLVRAAADLRGQTVSHFIAAVVEQAAHDHLASDDVVTNRGMVLDSTGRSRKVRKSRGLNRPKKPRRYVLYEGYRGEPRSHWQYRGQPTVPNCYRCYGAIYPPPFRWVVSATGVREACKWVRQSTRSRGAGLGILWDRKYDAATPPPLGTDLTTYWAVVSQCCAPTISLWHRRGDAEATKTRLDKTGCGGSCQGPHGHEVVQMTKDEAACRKPEWVSGPDPLDPTLAPTSELRGECTDRDIGGLALNG